MTERNIIRPALGKYQHLIDSAIHELSFIHCDEIIGDVETTGYYTLLIGEPATGLLGLIKGEELLTQAERDFLGAQCGAILGEDSQGFVSITYCESFETLRSAWDEIRAAVEGAR